MTDAELADWLPVAAGGTDAPAPRDDDSLAGLECAQPAARVIDEVQIDGLLAQVRLRVGDQRLTRSSPFRSALSDGFEPSTKTATEV